MYEFVGLCSGGILIHVSGNHSSGNVNSLGASVILTAVQAEDSVTRLANHTKKFENRVQKFSAAIRDAETPCYANTALYPHSSLTLSPEHHSPFVFSEVFRKICIHLMTTVHEVREVDCLSILFRPLDYCSLRSNLLFVPNRKVLQLKFVSRQVRMTPSLSFPAQRKERVLPRRRESCPRFQKLHLLRVMSL